VKRSDRRGGGRGADRRHAVHPVATVRVTAAVTGLRRRRRRRVSPTARRRRGAATVVGEHGRVDRGGRGRAVVAAAAARRPDGRYGRGRRRRRRRLVALLPLPEPLGRGRQQLVRVPGHVRETLLAAVAAGRRARRRLDHLHNNRVRTYNVHTPRRLDPVREKTVRDARLNSGFKRTDVKPRPGQARESVARVIVKVESDRIR